MGDTWCQFSSSQLSVETSLLPKAHGWSSGQGRSGLAIILPGLKAVRVTGLSTECRAGKGPYQSSCPESPDSVLLGTHKPQTFFSKGRRREEEGSREDPHEPWVPLRRAHRAHSGQKSPLLCEVWRWITRTKREIDLHSWATLYSPVWDTSPRSLVWSTLAFCQFYRKTHSQIPKVEKWPLTYNIHRHENCYLQKHKWKKKTKKTTNGWN